MKNCTSPHGSLNFRLTDCGGGERVERVGSRLEGTAETFARVLAITCKTSSAGAIQACCYVVAQAAQMNARACAYTTD
jgi:hypothetical protein